MTDTTQGLKGRGKHGFTLVELLVVISIIALLAAILMPSLAKAREMAKASQCLSNMKNIGSGMTIYVHDNRGYFPASYNYVNGASSAGGYYHWTAALNPGDYGDAVTSGKYPKYAEQYTCPSHTPGGWAPTNFTPGRVANPPAGQVSQDATNTIDDRQAPRLSYVADEIIMPRKKFSAAYDANSPPGTRNLRLASADEVEASQHTILMAEFSDNSNCIWGASVGGGSAYKSHRPTSGIKTDQANGVFDGEGYTLGTKAWKLGLAEATSAISAVLSDKAAAPTSHHISYINPNTHSSGSNYIFVDGHASKQTLDETLDPGNYMWGRRVYTAADRPVIQDNP